MKPILTIALIVISLSAMAQSHPQISGTDTVENHSEIPATFPGGAEGWIKYLNSNLRSELGAKYLKPGRKKLVKQTVIVSFLVDTAGDVVEVQIRNPETVHPKLGEEAVRVISEGPKWIPASMDGKHVIFRQLQPITFMVAG